MEANVAGSAMANGMRSISEELYAKFMKDQQELKSRRIADNVKAMGSIKSGILRQRLALRRIDIKQYAPDADLVAYDAIHKLKNPNGDSKQKIIVTDNEIKAYKVLDPDFDKPTITLADVLNKVEDLKAKGELTNAGDNTEDGDEGVEV